jgi:hypothetical protein
MPTKPRILENAITRIGGNIKPGVGGHMVAVYQGKRAHIPRHGGGFEIPDKLVDKILRDLGLLRKDVGLE